MKSLEQLWCLMAKEAAIRCHVSTDRDIQTLSRRVEDEGISFLTITLPTLAKGLERALDQGYASSGLWTSFSCRGGYPKFLGGFLRKIFDASGTLLPEPDIDCIAAVRQLCYLFHKLELECTDARKLKAVQSFWQTNDECLLWDSNPGYDLDRITAASTRYLGKVLSHVDRLIRDGRLVPRHGPGKTATRETGNEKFDFRYWDPRLDQVFPWVDWGIPNYRFAFNEWNENLVSPPIFKSHPAKLTLVPKTLKTPRVIVQEPTANQYMQQALLRELVNAIEGFTPCIGFTSQEMNQDMAQSASKNGRLATLDLSEASDRVTFGQARAAFKRYPHLWDALVATRSDEVSDGTVTGPVFRFASMGSAVCFPVEAIVFFLAIMCAMEDDNAGRVVPRSAREGRVRVYGDDILVPVSNINAVHRTFAALGWRINDDKSFWSGKFRESCGGDFYDGWDVKPVRLKQLLPKRRQDATELSSLVSFRNHLYMRGYWNTAGWLDSVIGKVIPFPIVGPQSSGLGRHSLVFEPRPQATNRMHQHLVRAAVARPRIPKSIGSDRASLLKCLIGSYPDPAHLQQTGRPLSVDIKIRWVPAH